jgi:hypothetical protein
VKQRLEQLGMRLALGHHDRADGAGRLQDGKAGLIVEQRGAEAARGFDRERAEMLGQPRAPLNCQQGSRLKRASQLRSMYEAGMPAVLARQQGCHGTGLAMRPGRQHDALVTPFHVSEPAATPKPRCGTGPELGVSRCSFGFGYFKSC